MKKTIRHQAVDILNAVSQTQAFAGNLLDACLEAQGLSGSTDGRLLTHLVYGVLRMRAHLDWLLSQLYRGDYSKMDECVKNILRTGLFQLKFSDRLPAFAVVDEAVKTAKKIAPAADGLVNAVLRSYLRNTDKITFPSPEKNPADYIAAFYSHPLWLVSLWLQVFGREETAALCRQNNEFPPLTLRVNTLKISRPAFMEKLKAEDFHCTPASLSPDGIILQDPPRPIQKTIFFKDGLFRLQDEAAQLVSYLVSPRSGESILDACAGSGGKTTHLASLMSGQGRITALDRSAEKITQLKKESSRLGIVIIDTLQADLNHPLSAGLGEKFDRVLVDAPCSGSGTLGRNPEIKWRLKPGDVQTLAKTQKTILRHAAAAVKSGGCLIYCTCSLLPQENDDVVRNFLTDFPEFSIANPSSVALNGLFDPCGFFRTFPHHQRTDGFFGAVLRRRN